MTDPKSSVILRAAADLISPPGAWTQRAPVDLLDGVDKAARDQIAANILAFLGEEAEELIVAEARS